MEMVLGIALERLLTVSTGRDLPFKQVGRLGLTRQEITHLPSVLNVRLHGEQHAVITPLGGGGEKLVQSRHCQRRGSDDCP